MRSSAADRACARTCAPPHVTHRPVRGRDVRARHHRPAAHVLGARRVPHQPAARRPTRSACPTRGCSRTTRDPAPVGQLLAAGAGTARSSPCSPRSSCCRPRRWRRSCSRDTRSAAASWSTGCSRSGCCSRSRSRSCRCSSRCARSGLLSNPLGVALPQAAFGLPIAIVIMRPFFRGDAAGAPGRGAHRRVRSVPLLLVVMLPLSRPVLSTIAVITHRRAAGTRSCCRCWC